VAPLGPGPRPISSIWWPFPALTTVRARPGADCSEPVAVTIWSGATSPCWPAVDVHATIVCPRPSAVVATVQGIAPDDVSRRVGPNPSSGRDCATHTPRSVAIVASNLPEGSVVSVPIVNPVRFPASREALPNRPLCSSDSVWTVLQHVFPVSLPAVNSLNPVRSYARSSTSCAPGTANGGLTLPPAARIARKALETAGWSWSRVLNAVAAALRPTVTPTGVRSVV